MPKGIDENQGKKKPFAFSLVYIKCFRTYSLSLSLRLPAQILYAGIHLCPLAVSRSCFGYSLSHLRTAAACLSRCIRHRRRSKAKPLRGRRGRSRAVHRFFLCAPHLSECAATGGTPKHFAQRAKYFTRAKRVFHRAEGAISHGSKAAVFHCEAPSCF